MAQNDLKRMIVEKESSAIIIFGATFDKIEVDHELNLMNSPCMGSLAIVLS